MMPMPTTTTHIATQVARAQREGVAAGVQDDMVAATLAVERDGVLADPAQTAEGTLRTCEKSQRN